MQTNQVAVTASLLFLAALTLAPSAAAVASPSMLGGSCTRTGDNFCAFPCSAGDRITLSFVGTGAMVGSCGGITVACETGTSGSCGGTSTLVVPTSSDLGVCIMVGFGTGTCSAA